jgi:serine/threonine-protein kinase HipA
MKKCTVEIWTDGQWHECCTIEIKESTVGGFGTSIVDYDAGYVFSGKSAPVSLRLPVNLTFTKSEHWPSFLFDLIPQGKGRHYLLGELKLADGPAADWQLICAGAFNPIGRLRVKEAVSFYDEHIKRQDKAMVVRGFKLSEIVERKDDFIEHLYMHGMLSAGTSGVQGVAPKFMLTLGKDDLWYADGAISDAHAKKHYLIKLPRGRDPSDLKILRNEAAFLRTANALGLCVEELPELHEDMLFIPRFDRKVSASGIERRHQESAASLVGQIGFDQRPSQNELLAALRSHVSDKTTTTIEFLKRDVLNLAMGNTDNHARNTAVQIVEGHVQLTPLFDFAPMTLDKEGIARALRWKNQDNIEITNWVDVLASLDLDKAELVSVTNALHTFGNHIEQLSEVMAAQGVDSDIIENRYHAIQKQIKQLRDLKAGFKAGDPHG